MNALTQGRLQAIRFSYPEWNDDQVQERLKEIESYCEQKEKEWKNPKLVKIWAKKSNTFNHRG